MTAAFSPMTDPIRRAERVLAALPGAGLFAGKEWRVSPEPFPLSRQEWKRLEDLGPLLLRFQRACDLIYRRSRGGSLPGWVADRLDRGKPESLLAAGLTPASLTETPRVIRPDLILTEAGFSATELDSVPGGIGLTAWLGATYAAIDPSHRIVGGATGMGEGFASIFPQGEADILISREAADYRPEMDWLAARLPGRWRVEEAESYEPSGRDLYRFFELFDLPNLPAAASIMEAVAKGRVRMTGPFKPWLEEKLWAAHFWAHPLREIWKRELREANWRRLREIFPQSWIVDPVELPHQGVIPGLEIGSFGELKTFSQRERELVLKLSGFDERAWGARSVVIGQDVPQSEWGEAVDRALASFESAPYLLQRFHGGRLVRHPWWNPETGLIETMEGRARLCPYYFVSAKDDSVSLGGVLATICPAEKKILHGMSEAILVPCRIEG